MNENYYLKVVNGIVFVEKIYKDENAKKDTERLKAKQLVIGKLGEPFFSPESWVKKLLQ